MAMNVSGTEYQRQMGKTGCFEDLSHIARRKYSMGTVLGEAIGCKSDTRQGSSGRPAERVPCTFIVKLNDETRSYVTHYFSMLLVK